MTDFAKIGVSNSCVRAGHARDLRLRNPQTALAGTGRIAGKARSYTTLAQANGFILPFFVPARPA